jgi:cytidylate kinase
MAVIAINQQLGSSGEELGRRAADRLGYRFMTGAEIIAAASLRHNVTQDQLLIVDERRPNFWERVRTDSAKLYCYFQAAALREMAKDKLVLVGRTIAQNLPDVGCGFRVRTVAPFAERVKKVAAQEERPPAATERRLRDHDREIRGRIMTLSGFDLDEPGNYHLMLNVFSTPLDALVDALHVCAQHIDRGASAAAWQAMRDTALAVQVRAALLSHPKLGNAPLKVSCHAGVVEVNGPGLGPPWDDLVYRLGMEVEGVESVRVEDQPIEVRLE